MKIIRVILWWIFVLLIPVLFISTAVRVEVQCVAFYEYEYEKNHISEVTGFDKEQLGIITRHLIQFFNDKVESPQLVVEKDHQPMLLFHDHEIIHLQDVKAIFQYVYKIQLISLGYFLFYLLISLIFRKKKKLIHFWRGLKNGSILTIGLLFGLGVGAFFGFHQLFIQFHYLVFGDPQSSPWILDPRKDHLVMMYPLGFWQDALMIGIIAIFAVSILFIGLGWFFSRKYPDRRR